MNPLEGQERGSEPGVCLTWTYMGLSHITLGTFIFSQTETFGLLRKVTTLEFGIFNLVLNLFLMDIFLENDTTAEMNFPTALKSNTSSLLRLILFMQMKNGLEDMLL